jgi:hypothetical protein
MPQETLKMGLIHFADYPPENTSFLTTRLWDKHLPGWRQIKRDRPPVQPDAESEKKLVDEINRETDSAALTSHDEHDLDKLDYVTIRRKVYPRKGKWLRFSEEQIKRIQEHERSRNPDLSG